MKTKILGTLVLLFSLLNYSCKAQCDNGNAIKQFSNDLETITRSIEQPETNLKDLPSIIEKIEDITSIESESDGNYLGKFHPTHSDVAKWKSWFESNKEKICWNGKKNLYYIQK